MFCSVIIPTVGRDTLARAVESVLCQALPAQEREIIVVNDSGRPLPPAAWQRAPGVRVISTRRRERSVARNTGAAIAAGDFLLFLDDDDWLADGALPALQATALNQGGAWIYGQTMIVDRQDQHLLLLRHGLRGNAFLPVLAGEWIPLQASLIRSTAFFACGGFAPRLTGPEDIDLLRRIALTGDLTECDAHVAYVRMGAGETTTDYANHARRSRAAREQILDQPGTFRRLLGGAVSPGWRGRLLRIYATSLVWNLQQRRPLTACSRGTSALAALLLAGTSLLVPDYWRSFAHSYQSQAFERGRQSAS